jgi:hypothetical protein
MKKNAKDYIQDNGHGSQTVTSLAYWLTPEGLSNPFVAALLRDAIERSSESEFFEAFDGATKDEAREFLAAYELCAMPYWGAEELARAIHAADAGRSENLAFRAVTLSQNVQELAHTFTPKQGIEWAMARGYLFGDHARFVGAAVGRIGHPHNALSHAPTAAPLAVAGAFDEPDKTRATWSLKTSKLRFNGYRWQLHQVLKAAHAAGKPCPTAREVLVA